MPSIRPLAVPLAVLFAALPAAQAQSGVTQASADVPQVSGDATTESVFRRFSPPVVKIQVAETGSGARSNIGSGFFVDDKGVVVTNYHVIASLISTPKRYRAELLDQSGARHPVRVVAIDAMHDLALLSTGLRGRPFLRVAPSPVAQGTRLFSLGHPHDLPLSIVEGTYNGHNPHALYPRVHLTAPLNPGVSGGPTIDRNGRVVGVNVSTAGDQVSFLVPVEHLVPLIAKASLESESTEPSMKQVGRQLREHQDDYLREMFDSSAQTLEFGPFVVPTQPAPFFRCWGDAEREEDMPYETSWHRCTSDDDIYLDEDQSTGTLSLLHQLVITKTLNRSRFFALYTNMFKYDNSTWGTREYVTNWSCATRNVQTEALPLRAVLCLRRYRQLGELYDGFLQVAVLGPKDTGLVSTMNVKGASFENVTRLTERFLGAIRWR